MTDLLVEKEHHFDAVKIFNQTFGVSCHCQDMAALKILLGYFSKFPYENISKIIKYNQFFGQENRIRLPGEVMEDHRAHFLGGTCFSLTYFLETILTYHGYPCYPIMADMRYGRNVHCALVVTVDHSKYLVDPGYLLNQPIPVTTQDSIVYKNEFLGIELTYEHEKQQYHLYTYTRSEKKWRYQFMDRPVSKKSLLNHWLASFAWNSMHGLCLYRLDKNKMTYIHKYFMRETGPNQKRNHNIRAQYHKTIYDIFHISQELVDKALSVVQENMAKDKASGIWVPRQRIGGE